MKQEYAWTAMKYDRRYLDDEVQPCSVAFKYRGEEFENVEEIAELMDKLRVTLASRLGVKRAEFGYSVKHGTFEIRTLGYDGEKDAIAFEDQTELARWLVGNNTGVELVWFREVETFAGGGPVFETYEECMSYIRSHYPETGRVFPGRVYAESDALKAMAVYLSGAKEPAATDVEFAEFFARFWWGVMHGKVDELTSDMMNEINLDDLSELIKNSLEEIIYGNSDCPEQWWKQVEINL